MVSQHHVLENTKEWKLLVQSLSLDIAKMYCIFLVACVLKIIIIFSGTTMWICHVETIIVYIVVRGHTC